MTGSIEAETMRKVYRRLMPLLFAMMFFNYLDRINIGSFSAVLGGPISTTLMTYANGLWGLQGWQWMFILEGVPAMLLGLLTLRVMTERPTDASWLRSEEKQWLESTLAAERESLG